MPTSGTSPAPAASHWPWHPWHFLPRLPMAYCRYACGTGRLLEYLRHSARSDRFLLADGVLLALLLLSAIVR